MTRVLALLLLVLVGCGTTQTPVAPTFPPVTGVTQEAPAPVTVTIPAIDATSSLIGLGLDADGAVAVPPVTEPMQAAWFEPGVKPGEVGPAVVLGHVSGRLPGTDRSGPGVFAHLDELTPGDEILVDRADGSTVVFEVTAVEVHDKNSFPTDAVWSDTAVPALRLITCGGSFDAAERSYESNVIVWAGLVGLR